MKKHLSSLNDELVGLEPSQSTKIRVDRGVLRVQAKLAIFLSVLFAAAAGFGVFWYSDHLLMAIPFLILFIIPIVGAITMQSFDKAQAEEESAIFDDTNLAHFHQRESGHEKGSHNSPSRHKPT
jgi:hypothetical protein